jgi:hypothetical protein
MEVSSEDIKCVQKRVLNHITSLSPKKSKAQFRGVLDILAKYGYDATKTSRGYLVNIGELSTECLFDIYNYLESPAGTAAAGSGTVATGSATASGTATGTATGTAKGQTADFC